MLMNLMTRHYKRSNDVHMSEGQRPHDVGLTLTLINMQETQLLCVNEGQRPHDVGLTLTFTIMQS